MEVLQFGSFFFGGGKKFHDFFLRPGFSPKFYSNILVAEVLKLLHGASTFFLIFFKQGGAKQPEPDAKPNKKNPHRATFFSGLGYLV